MMPLLSQKEDHRTCPSPSSQDGNKEISPKVQKNTKGWGGRQDAPARRWVGAMPPRRWPWTVGALAVGSY